jgi:two-component system KDP operon response regulator KdpE
MAAQPLVMIVDDEPAILRLLRVELTAQGFRVLAAGSGEEALATAEECRPDIALVDILMPNMTGMELMFELRSRWNTPVILVTARDKQADKVRGLELGADDYIVKPFSPEEVGARIRAVLRRATGMPADRIVRAGDVEIDLMRRRALRAGNEVALTRTEWLLLEQLAANAGRVLFTAELLSRVWGPEYRDELQYLRVWVSRLRQKLGDTPGEPHIIKTFPGIGYRFDADEAVETEIAV